MSDHFQIQCPGCQKILKVPATMGGKVVDCPNCKTALQIAAPSTSSSPSSAPLNIDLPTDVPTSQQSAPIVPPPQSAIPNSPAPFQGDPLAPLPGSPPTAPGAGWQGGRAVTPKKRKYSKTTNVQEEEPESSESALANIGYFLVVTAILAIVLPMFGLQLRRLRNAGEFAPLIGIFLGLIGSGLIAAGSNARNRTQSFGIAAGCAVLVVVMGIGGFLLQGIGNAPNNAMAGQGGFDAKKRLEQQKEAARINNANRNRPNQNRPSIPNINSRNGTPAPFDPFAESKKRRDQHAAEAEKFLENSRQRNSDLFDSAQEQMEEAQRQLANNQPSSSPFSAGSRRPGRPSSSSPSSSPPSSSPPSSGNNPFKADNTPPGNASTPPKKVNNPFDSSAKSASPFGGSGGFSLFDMTKRNNQGLDSIRLRITGNADLEANYKFVKIAGSDDAFGKVFYQNSPLEGIEFVQFDQRSFLIPADTSLPKHDERIDVPEGMAIVGLNFSSKNGKMVGVQCIFASPHEKYEGRYDVKNTTTSDWLGEETYNPTTTKTTGKPVVGLAVFSDISSITGVQLIITKK